jgi:hypothetical protein
MTEACWATNKPGTRVPRPMLRVLTMATEPIREASGLLGSSFEIGT